MDEVKKTIRPELPLKEASTAIEQFQNTVLRPILKLQNNVLAQLFIQFSKKQKKDPFNLSKEKLIEFLKQVTEKNIVFRNQQIGVVIGMLTEKEFSFYHQNTSELNKRIITMLRKRLLDNFTS